MPSAPAAPSFLLGGTTNERASKQSIQSTIPHVASPLTTEPNPVLSFLPPKVSTRPTCQTWRSRWRGTRAHRRRRQNDGGPRVRWRDGWTDGMGLSGGTLRGTLRVLPCAQKTCCEHGDSIKARADYKVTPATRPEAHLSLARQIAISSSRICTDDRAQFPLPRLSRQRTRTRPAVTRGSTPLTRRPA